MLTFTHTHTHTLSLSHTRTHTHKHTHTKLPYTACLAVFPKCFIPVLSSCPETTCQPNIFSFSPSLFSLSISLSFSHALPCSFSLSLSLSLSSLLLRAFPGEAVRSQFAQCTLS